MTNMQQETLRSSSSSIVGFKGASATRYSRLTDRDPAATCSKQEDRSFGPLPLKCRGKEYARGVNQMQQVHEPRTQRQPATSKKNKNQDTSEPAYDIAQTMFDGLKQNRSRCF
jgi:hypothetical protein